MDTANYNCSQEELNSVCNKGWTSCEAQQGKFEGFKKKYSLVFIGDKMTAVADADALPTEAQREEAEETCRVLLKADVLIGCALWQSLKRYITEAFAENVLQIKLNAAGMGSYEKAANENWESAQGLMKLGNQFIADNLTALTANDNMPPTFQDTFKNSAKAVNDAITAFQTAESDSITGTQTKTKAMNAIFADLMVMFLDGQEIFKTDEAMKKQFTFEQVLKLVSGNSAQGFKGTVTSSLTGLAIDKVTITVLMTKHSTVGDKEGVYGMRNVASGDNYTVTFQCEGYKTATFTGQKVVVGVMGIINVQLVPVA